MSTMKKLDQHGVINVLVVPLVLMVLLFLSAASFAVWAFSGRQDFKNNVDKKIAAAVTVAEQKQQQADAANYAQQEKQPLRTYVGPAQFGNITVKYPKTWSAYASDSGTSGNPIDGYFQPGTVPNTTDPNSSYALRVMLLQQAYDQVMQQFQGGLASKALTVAPYALPKVPSVVGSRIEGQIEPQKQGVMIVLPLRNMTLEVWTESANFKSDLDTNILPNFSFQP